MKGWQQKAVEGVMGQGKELGGRGRRRAPEVFWLMIK